MRFIVVLAAVASAIVVSAEPAAPLTIPLTKVKRDLPQKSSQIGKRNLPLMSFGDVLYYGNGTVRNQTFQFLFDTGSSDVVLPGPLCPWNMCGSGDKYDEGGKNLSKIVELPYGSGKIIGDLFEDSVSIDGKTARNQVVVSAEINELLRDSDVNGVIGLAFAGASQTNGTTFFDNLMKQGAVPTPEIGMYVGSLDYGRDNQGELVLGGRNEKHFDGPLTELPVVDEFYWTVSVDRVEIGGKCVGNATRNNTASIDSGTAIIVGPKAATKQVFAAIPGAHITKNKTVGGDHDDWNYYLLPCNTIQAQMPSLIMGGRSFEIPVHGIMGPQSNDEDGMCEADFFGTDSNRPEAPNMWILGDAFLRHWYAIYSHKGANGKPSVSLARAKH